MAGPSVAFCPRCGRQLVLRRPKSARAHYAHRPGESCRERTVSRLLIVEKTEPTLRMSFAARSSAGADVDQLELGFGDEDTQTQ